jgi:L-asparagine oxygenase
MDLYKNVPTGDIPDTPSTNTYNIGSHTVMAKHQAEIVKRYGTIVKYVEECDSFFQDIVPMKTSSYLQTSTGSEKPLEIHTEQAFSEDRPNFLSLACLKGDSNAITYILTLDTILKHLTEDEINYLKLPLWMCKVDLSFLMRGTKNSLKGPMAILQENGTKLVFDQDLMSGIVPKADKMITKIVEIYDKYKTGITLETGDVIVINNRIAVHGRSKFTPRYDGTDRFLIRCFAK